MSGAGGSIGDREQKLLESATDGLLIKLNEIKGSVASLIRKLETDPTLNWESFLDSYALVSGQLNSFLKFVKQERTPVLKKYATLPLILSPDKDEDLLKLTESRVPSFSHDLVPDLLRTKPIQKWSPSTLDSSPGPIPSPWTRPAKQLAVIEKITNGTLKFIAREREEMESKAHSRSEIEKTVSTEDTLALVASIGVGRGLKPQIQPTPMHHHMTPANRAPVHLPQSKAPSSIKTNIKAASQVHPYQRQ
ncbi:Mediator of RNA polymerase II transcription subunit 8 [Caligus rogercresseyi]|uniref:Mediator of RNA polymerase II transcription subunit 8 n=1 Tax=Caligus rogercresseyi TaxID=217165 RepID=A0A7T8KFQ2_CALRO|nr:Mediator of RNA polymerase II transcription subunit 8 [Caligus rogercresseyi]